MLPMAYLSLSHRSTVCEFISVKDELVATVHRLYSFCNPALIIQRCLRGHFGRRYFRKYRIRIMMPTVVLQHWMYRRFVARVRLLDLEMPATNHASAQIPSVVSAESLCTSSISDSIRAAIMALPLSKDTAVYDNLGAASDLYFVPDDTVRLQSLLENVRSIFPEGMFPTLLVSNLVLHAVGSASIAHWIPYFQVLVTQEYRERTLAQGNPPTLALFIFMHLNTTMATADIFSSLFSLWHVIFTTRREERFLAQQNFASLHEPIFGSKECIQG